MPHAMDTLKKQGLVTDEQLKNLSPEAQKVLDSLDDNEIKALDSIKKKAANAGFRRMTDGNIIF